MDETDDGKFEDFEPEEYEAESDEDIDADRRADPNLVTDDTEYSGSDDEDLDDDIDEDEEDDHATVATGSSIEEAKLKALAQLRKVLPNVTEAEIEYLVVEEGSRGSLLGRRRTLPRVEARVRFVRSAPDISAPIDEDVAHVVEALREFLATTVELMGVIATVATSSTPETIIAEISGDDLGLLIGRHGQTIDALQYLSAVVVNRQHKTHCQVIVDAEGYRGRRASTLNQLADRVAQRVAREQVAVALKPMSAAERKVIHLHLKDHPRVATASEGQEPHRSVVISPRRKP